jgi:hypothetical protein
LAIDRILPTLATKQDVRDEVAKLATRDDLRLRTEGLQDDLRLTTEALQHEIEAGFDQAKSHADTLNEITRAQIRLLAEQMATKEDLQDLRQEMATTTDLQATKADLQELRADMRVIGGDVRAIARQVALLSARKRKKQ